MTTPVVAIDTNVLLDTVSIHDLLAEYHKQHVDLDTSELIFRRARARESLLAMMYLNKVKAPTLSLHSEFLTQLEKNSPPTATPGTHYPTDFTKAFVWFIKDRVLPDWEWQITDPRGERGNAADQALVDAALRHGVPLITNEGFNKDGYGEGGIGRRARAAGVPWFHPHGYYQGKIDEAAEIGEFFQRCQMEAPQFLADHWRDVGGRDKWDELLDFVILTYRHVLLGETRGRVTPVRVAL